ncbi:MAG TPA: 50S ribosomal protein L4 [Elusimicrobiales bacterium]|nr:50S ribosomal protein L4 [Elusimicrobiales bacterium]
METTVLNMQGAEVGKCNLPDNVFDRKPQKYLLHEVITLYMSNKRQGSANTKTRAEVSGGGKKPWKQKGTGRARHGSTRSPLWKGGGVAFGPKPRDFSKDMPRKKKQLALKQALSAQFIEGNIVIVDKFELEESKTKKLDAVLSGLKAGKKPMLVTLNRDEKITMASRNIKGFKCFLPKNLNAYDILNSTKIIFTRDAVGQLSEPSVKEQGK